VFSVRRLNRNENELGMHPDESPGCDSESTPRNWNRNQRRRKESVEPPARASVRSRREVESNFELFDTICS